MCVCIAVFIHTHAFGGAHEFGGQRIRLGVDSCLPHFFQAGPLVSASVLHIVSYLEHKLPGDSPVSISHFTLGVLGFEMWTTISGFWQGFQGSQLRLLCMVISTIHQTTSLAFIYMHFKGKLYSISASCKQHLFSYELSKYIWDSLFILNF